MAEEFRTLNVDLVVLSQNIDTSTSTGRLLYNVLASVAEFEADLIRDRVNAGIARAMKYGTKSGKPFGRPKIPPAKEAKIRLMLQRGHSIPQISRLVGCGYGTIQRVKRALQGQPQPVSR